MILFIKYFVIGSDKLIIFILSKIMMIKFILKLNICIFEFEIF